jgi:hypothetical protein
LAARLSVARIQLKRLKIECGAAGRENRTGIDDYENSVPALGFR